MLEVGNKAPEFSLVNQNGDTIDNSNFEGKKYVVFFYPKANTPGCTNEACNLRDNYHSLIKQGFNIIGVSPDTVEKQKKWSDKLNLPFPLLADTELKLANAFGVWGPKKFMGREYDGIHRTTFIIDENGSIQEVVQKVKTKEHAKQILNEDV